jgi:hypothetical protein
MSTTETFLQSTGIWNYFLLGIEVDNIPDFDNIEKIIKHSLIARVNKILNTENDFRIKPGNIIQTDELLFGHAMIARGNHYSQNETYLHITDIGNSTFTNMNCINQTMIHNPEKYKDYVTIVKFIGGSQEENTFLNLAVAILADYIGRSNSFTYGGRETERKCIKHKIFKKDKQEITDIIDSIYASIINSNPSYKFICSSFAISLWQIVLKMFKPDYLEQFLLIDPIACMPKDILTLKDLFPKGWKNEIMYGFNLNPDQFLHFPNDCHSGIEPDGIYWRRLFRYLVSSKNEYQQLHSLQTLNRNNHIKKLKGKFFKWFYYNNEIILLVDYEGKFYTFDNELKEFITKN